MKKKKKRWRGPWTKLNWADSYKLNMEIKAAIKNGKPSMYSLAKKYGITPSAVFCRKKQLKEMEKT